MDRPADRLGPNSELLPGENTTIGMGPDAKLTKKQANRVATVAHDGWPEPCVPHTQ
jgi:L-aminopeptidase/D-esterase-like protein